MKYFLFLLIIIILAGTFYIGFTYFNPTDEATNFEECITAGNPAMESYPRQCRDGENTFTEVLETSCTNSSDCLLPMEYAIQSNCPYQTACINDSCAVICPLWEHSPNPEESVSYEVACTETSDCDCSDWDSENKHPCDCVDGQCASVVAQ